ncbi:hypothetical protein ACLOJK_014452 [Asimina triloba]
MSTDANFLMKSVTTMDPKGSACRIKKCVFDLLSIGELIDDEDSWDLVGRDLRLRSTFLYCDFNQVISNSPDEQKKKILTDLANKLFYYIEECFECTVAPHRWRETTNNGVPSETKSLHAVTGHELVGGEIMALEGSDFIHIVGMMLFVESDRRKYLPRVVQPVGVTEIWFACGALDGDESTPESRNGGCFRFRKRALSRLPVRPRDTMDLQPQVKKAQIIRTPYAWQDDESIRSVHLALDRAVKIRSMSLTQNRYNDTAVVLQEVMSLMP